MPGEHFSVHEGRQKSPVEKFVLKLSIFSFLMGNMRLTVFQKKRVEWAEGRKKGKTREA